MENNELDNLVRTFVFDLRENFPSLKGSEKQITYRIYEVMFNHLKDNPYFLGFEKEEERLLNLIKENLTKVYNITNSEELSEYASRYFGYCGIYMLLLIKNKEEETIKGYFKEKIKDVQAEALN